MSHLQRTGPRVMGSPCPWTGSANLQKFMHGNVNWSRPLLQIPLLIQSRRRYEVSPHAKKLRPWGRDFLTLISRLRSETVTATAKATLNNPSTGTQAPYALLRYSCTDCLMAKKDNGLDSPYNSRNYLVDRTTRGIPTPTNRFGLQTIQAR